MLQQSTISMAVGFSHAACIAGGHILCGTRFLAEAASLASCRRLTFAFCDSSPLSYCLFCIYVRWVDDDSLHKKYTDFSADAQRAQFLLLG